MPRSGRTRVASRALRRSAAAMLRCPWARRTPMARLRRLAMARGAVPVRTSEASSAKVTSRTWCNASIAQWPRIQSARRAGWAWAAVRLVTACNVTVRQRRLRRDRTRRVMRRAWVAWGKSRPATVVTCRRRTSTRWWPRSRVSSTTGTSRHGRVASWWCSAGWLGDQPLGVLALGMQRVGGDHPPGKVQPLEQRPELGDLVGLAVHVGLGQDRTGGVVHHRQQDRKSTRLNSSHITISYAVFCLKKKKKKNYHIIIEKKKKKKKKKKKRKQQN